MSAQVTSMTAGGGALPALQIASDFGTHPANLVWTVWSLYKIIFTMKSSDRSRGYTCDLGDSAPSKTFSKVKKVHKY